MSNKRSNIVKDFFSLSIANIVSIVAVMIQGMILTRALTKFDMGTYSQANTVLNITNSVIGLGLNNALNYFIPKTQDKKVRTRYVNNIFSMIFILGIVGAVGIVLFSGAIVSYFKNDSLRVILFAISLRPLFYSVLNGYINLYVANKQSSFMAKRNITISCLSLCIVGLISIFLKDVTLILVSLTLLDMFQCIYFYFISRRKFGKIKYFYFNKKITKSILAFSIPLALANASGTLLKSMDSLIIGRIFDTESLAEYAVVGRELPFAFFTSSIITVTRPYIVEYLNKNQLKNVCRLWADSIELSSIITWTFCFAAMVVSPELIKFLYTDKYSSGLVIFNIYIVAQMVRITYFGMILNAAGKSKWVLIYSLITLAVNIILNYIFYYIFGYIGPALATVASIIIMGATQFFHSSKLIKHKIRDLLNIKSMTIELVVMFSVMFILVKLKKFILLKFDLTNIITIIIFMGLYCFIIGVFYLKKIKLLSKAINYKN